MILPYSLQSTGNEIRAENGGITWTLWTVGRCQSFQHAFLLPMKLAWPTGRYQSTLAPPIGSSNNDIILQPNMGCWPHGQRPLFGYFMSEVSLEVHFINWHIFILLYTNDIVSFLSTTFLFEQDNFCFGWLWKHVSNNITQGKLKILLEVSPTVSGVFCLFSAYFSGWEPK